jgi:hypothetical protein
VQAQPREVDAEPRILRRVPEVAGQGKRQPASDRVTVNRGDRGNRQPQEREVVVVVGAHDLTAGLDLAARVRLDEGHVATRAERLPRAAEHEDAHVLAMLDPPKRLGELLAHPLAHGIPAGRLVQGEDGDPVAHLEEKHLRHHASAPRPGGRRL